MNEVAVPTDVEQPVSNVPLRVVTRMRFAAAPERVWAGLLYYEQIEDRPSLLLRLLLPVPVRTTGRKSEVGDEVLCEYERGHLKKRITELQRFRAYRFEVFEQSLALGPMRLHGGAYVLSAAGDDGCEVELETRYTSARWPRWLWRPIESAVCHAFHRHILRAMRRAILGQAPTP